MKVFSIGFTQSTAEHFFARLKKAGVKKVLDVRLNNVSQLAGFAKKDDLAYFLEALGGIGYAHEPQLAPTQELIDSVRKGKPDWAGFEKKFLALMKQRQVEQAVPKSAFDRACLLCSEDTPKHCHRRLVLEYLQQQWGGLDVVHL